MSLIFNRQVTGLTGDFLTEGQAANLETRYSRTNKQCVEGANPTYSMCFLLIVTK